jgi:hypothetical protein
MNDADVINEVRQRFDQVHLDTDLESVLSRGRSLRRRRRLRLPVTAVAAVAVAGGVLAATGVLPGTGSGPRPELAAWTVTQKPTGLVTVTIRQLSDPAGLQRTLRADGVRVFVRFNGQAPDDCANFPLKSGLALRKALPDDNAAGPSIAFAIDPAAIPSGAALWLQVVPETTNGSGVSSSGLGAQLVYASGHCPPATG